MTVNVESPTTDISNIAAVITGGEHLHLTGWPRNLAVEAMHALGWRRERMAEALSITRDHLSNLCAQLGLRMAEDTEPDWFAVQWVCEGAEMPLTGVDRDVAIRRLAALGRTAPQIAKVLCSKPHLVREHANRLGVVLPPTVVARADTLARRPKPRQPQPA